MYLKWNLQRQRQGWTGWRDLVQGRKQKFQELERPFQHFGAAVSIDERTVTMAATCVWFPIPKTHGWGREIINDPMVGTHFPFHECLTLNKKVNQDLLLNFIQLWTTLEIWIESEGKVIIVVNVINSVGICFVIAALITIAVIILAVVVIVAALKWLIPTHPPSLLTCHDATTSTSTTNMVPYIPWSSLHPNWLIVASEFIRYNVVFLFIHIQPVGAFGRVSHGQRCNSDERRHQGAPGGQWTTAGLKHHDGGQQSLPWYVLDFCCYLCIQNFFWHWTCLTCRTHNEFYEWSKMHHSCHERENSKFQVSGKSCSM